MAHLVRETLNTTHGVLHCTKLYTHCLTGEVYVKPVTSTQRVNVFLFNLVSMLCLFIEEAPVKKSVRTSQVSNDWLTIAFEYHPPLITSKSCPRPQPPIDPRNRCAESLCPFFLYISCGEYVFGQAVFKYQACRDNGIKWQWHCWATKCCSSCSTKTTAKQCLYEAIYFVGRE